MPNPVNPNPAPAVDERRWLARWLRVDAARLLWPARCLVCTAPGADGLDLCPDCAAGLPWNHHACARCALPVPAVPAATERVRAGAAPPATAGPGPANPVAPVSGLPGVDLAVAGMPLAGMPITGMPVEPLPDAERPAALCGACLRAQAGLGRRARPPALECVHAACVYAAPLDRLLPRLKFHRDLAAGALLAQLMARAFAGLTPPDALVPIPLHRARLRRRGYDQALELARPLARALELPLRADLLQRVRATAPQSQLDAAARRRNLRDAFAVGGADSPLPAHVVLVDDVMTTGATLHAAARALRRAGVARVDAWVCARVP